MSQPQLISGAIADHREPDPPAFACGLSYDDQQRAWVRAAGELDIASAPQLEHTLRRVLPRARLIVLDLRSLTFIDSCGVHVIADACDRMRCGAVVLQGPPQVQRVFELTGLARLLEIAADAAAIPDPAAALSA